MVAIAPFKALRYNLAAAGGDFSRLVAPPYDVISPEQQDRLYGMSPQNVVRLIYGKQFPDDSEANSRYTRAKQVYDAWRAGGVLTREKTPSVYVYEHTFAWGGMSFQRLGFIALLRFDDAAPGRVWPHEKTFDAPKADRTKLLDAVQAHLDPVFCLVPDQAGDIDRALRGMTDGRPPAASATIPATTAGGAGTAEERVALWAIPDGPQVQALIGMLAPRDVLIADGHHRFAVALSRRQAYPAVMTFFARLEDPAVAVRPIHRVATIEPKGAAALNELCVLQRVPSYDELQRWLETDAEAGQFGVYTQRGFYRGIVKPGVMERWRTTTTLPPALAQFDVAILHHVVLPPLIGPEVPGQPAVRYTPHAGEAVAMVDRHEGDWAWFLRPIRTGDVFSLAKQGLTMPQKSTYFYPKVLSGLVINPFEP